LDASLLLGAPRWLAAASGLLLVWQCLDPRPITFAGLLVDRLTTISILFVAVVGGVAMRFAARAMEGHAARERFLRLLAIAIFAAVLVGAGSSLPLLAAGWILLGAVVTRLVGFESASSGAARAAARHAWVARAGDATFVAALALIAWRGRTLDLREFLAGIEGMQVTELAPIAVLISIAAMTRAVQAPFHAWLPATAEAPTAVSALLHAGIVNAGGLLLIRASPVIVRVPEAWILLSAVGSIGITLGVISAWHQVRAKHALAWSTIAQMGFMTVQCAVAAFPAALLHLMGHGAYKALAFLSSGERPMIARAAPGAWIAVPMLALGTGAACGCMPLARAWTGFDPLHSPGESVLAFIVAIAVGQLWIAIASDVRGVRTGLIATLVACLAAIAVPTLSFCLYRAAGDFLAPVLGPLPVPEGPAAWIAAGMPLSVVFALSLLHACRGALETTVLARWLRVQGRSGFHSTVIADRLAGTIRALPTQDRRDLIHA